MSKRKIIITLLITLAIVAISRLSASYVVREARGAMLTNVHHLDPSDLGDFPTAAEGIPTFAARVKRNPADAISLTILGQLYLRQARETGDVSNYERAETALNRSLALLPDDAAAGLALASVYYAQHNFTEALSLAEQLYQEDPRRSQALATMGDAYLALGQYEAAEAAYQTLLGQGPTPPLLARLAHQAELHGRPDEALRLMQRAAGETLQAGLSKEEMAWYLIRLGDLYFNSGDIEAAGDHYGAALQVDDDDYIALAGLGKVRAAQGRYAEAIELYQQAVNIIPQPETLAALGDLYTVTGQPDQAQRQYDTVEFIGKLAEINQQVYNRQLANFYADHDQNLEQALGLAVAELELRQDVYGYDTAAWIYYKNGRLDEAQQMIEQAMRLGTRDAKLYYHAGMIAHAQGRPAEAERLLSEALVINPHFDLLQANIARTTLETLQSN